MTVKIYYILPGSSGVVTGEVSDSAAWYLAWHSEHDRVRLLFIQVLLRDCTINQTR
jgi:hypothetical protein